MNPLAWISLFQRWLEQLAPRERLLLALFGAIVAFYAFLTALEASVASRQKLGDVIAERSDARRAVLSDTAQSRKRDLDQQIDFVRMRSFNDKTHAIARAKAQLVFEQAGQRAGIAGFKVAVAPTPPGSSDLKTVKVTLEGPYEPGTYLALIRELAGIEQFLIVVSAGVEEMPGNVFRIEAEIPLGILKE